MYILNFFRGFLMALADSVPGVSGGTIAFIMGFYDELINSLNSLTSAKNKEERKEGILFLIKLGMGWVVGFSIAILALSVIFEREIYKISSLFVGFIVFSIPLIIIQEKSVVYNKYKNLIFTIIGILIVSAITYFNPISSGTGVNISFDKFSPTLAIYVLVIGMIAISAMILPGISGSTLLLIFGLYIPIVNAVKEFLTLNFTKTPYLICFGIGVIIGIVGIIKVVKLILLKYRSQSIYLIIGLMLGSIYAIFMGPTTLDIPKSPMNFESFSFIYFALGGVLIIGLQKIKDMTS